MRPVSSGSFRVLIAVLGCVILLGAMNAPGIAKNNRHTAVVTNPVGKGDRLPIATAAHGAQASPSKPALAAGKRPPLGCEPLFSPIADPAQANLYRRCAA